MKKFTIDDRVEWDWVKSCPQGNIVEIFTEPVTRKIKDSYIKRNGSPEKPAYLIEMDDGRYVLKLISEIRAV